MQIYGLNKTTLLDYPEHVAATVFTGGCQFRCPFCHNADLVAPEHFPGALSLSEVLAFLEKRKGILDGVCITGGEPTLQPELADFIRRIKSFGYLVKLDTNGYRPQVLEALLQEELLDYVAMDIKAAPENYGRATGVAGVDTEQIARSIRLLKEGDIPYEFRTTVVKGIHSIAEFDKIGAWLSGARAYFLQSFQDSGRVLQPGYGAFSREELCEMADLARKYIDRVSLRGIE